MSKFETLGTALGQLVDTKNVQYGDAAAKAGAILRTLYPAGIPVHAYDDALLVVRVLDKLSRIAQRGVDGRDLGGESPWRDLAGYGLLGQAKDERAVAGDEWTDAAEREAQARKLHEMETGRLAEAALRDLDSSCEMPGSATSALAASNLALAAAAATGHVVYRRPHESDRAFALRCAIHLAEKRGDHAEATRLSVLHIQVARCCEQHEG